MTPPPLCATDADCPSRLVCLRANFTRAYPGPAVCRCAPNFFGEECEETTGSTNVRVLMETILLLVVVGMFLTTVRDLVLSRRYKLFALGSNPTTQTQACLAVAFLAQSLVHFFDISCAIRATSFIMVGGFKACTWTPALVFVQLIALVFGYWSLVHISLLWKSVADRSKRLVKSSAHSRFEFRRFMYFLEGAFLLSVIGSFAAVRVDIASILLVPFGTLLIVMYTVAGLKLRQVLQEASSASLNQAKMTPVGENSYMDMNNTSSSNSNSNNKGGGARTNPLRTALRRVEVTAFCVVGFYSLCLVFLIVSVWYLNLYGAATYQPGGWDMPYSTFLLLTYMAQTCANLVVCWYTHMNFTTVLHRVKATFSSPTKSEGGDSRASLNAQNNTPNNRGGRARHQHPGTTVAVDTQLN